MGSEFGNQVEGSVHTEGWKEPVGVESERFLFYKVRVHGVLQLLKTPRPAFGHDLLTLETLRKEFFLCYGLTHPGLPRYYALEGNRLYEEFIEGDTLRQLMARKDPRLADAQFMARICRQLLEVLDYIHSHGVVHLDIKPENIMLTSIGESQLKLIDFGAAKSAANPSTPGFSPGYMAPEQNAGNVNLYTDIYQAGLLMDELSRIGGHRKKWESFIAGATASHPSRRFATSREALEAIPSEKAIRLGVRNVGIWILLIAVIVLFSALVWFSRSGGAAKEAEEMIEKTEIEEIKPANAIPSQGQPVSSAESAETESPGPTTIKTPERETSAAGASAGGKSTENIDKKLRNEISGYIKRNCQEILGTVIRNLEYDENGKVTFETTLRYRDAAYDVYYRCQAYTGQLVSRYPSKEDYIKMEMRLLLEEELMKWNERYSARVK